MTALVTGATGFLGSALVRRLLDAGEDLRLLLRPGSDTRALDAACAGAARAPERHTGSLDSHDAAVAALDGVDTVYHLAATMRGRPAEVLHGTLATSRHLIEAACAQPRPPRIVLVGSLAAYATATIPAGTCLDENAPLDPRPDLRDVYTHAKIEQERMFRDANRHRGLPLLVLRPGVLHAAAATGPSQRVGFATFSGRLYLLLGGDNPLPLTHVDNCASAIAFAAAHGRFDGDSYDVLDDDTGLRCRDYLERWRAARGSTGMVIALPYGATLAAAAACAWLHRTSRGRFPQVLSPYRARTTWKAVRHAGSALRDLGWAPPLPGTRALEATLGHDTP